MLDLLKWLNNEKYKKYQYNLLKLKEAYILLNVLPFVEYKNIRFFSFSYCEQYLLPSLLLVVLQSAAQRKFLSNKLDN